MKDQPATPPVVDLRAAARALLAGEGPLAITSAGRDCLVEVARASSPVLASDVDLSPLAFGEDDSDGFGRLNVTAGVATIPLKGVLTPRPSFLSILFGGSSGGLLGFRSDLRQALGHKDVKSIVIDVNSPGGSVSLITEVAAELREASGEKDIIAVANTMCASAAYEIAAQAQEIIVSPSGFVGSIGVYQVHYDWSAFNTDFGVDPTYITAGRYKAEGNQDTPLDAEALAALQATVDDFYDLFVADVAAGRGVTEDEVRNGYGEGRVLTAQRAVDAGLADRVGTLEQVLDELVNGAPGAGARATARQPRLTALTPHPDVVARVAALQALIPPVRTVPTNPPGGIPA